jgi:hypothetical protein
MLKGKRKVFDAVTASGTSQLLLLLYGSDMSLQL